jgi:ribosomal protein L15E
VVLTIVYIAINIDDTIKKIRTPAMTGRKERKEMRATFSKRVLGKNKAHELKRRPPMVSYSSCSKFI